MIPEFILASNSPRRRELLSMLGMDFQVMVSDCDESIEGVCEPDAIVRELALRKAMAVRKKLDNTRSFIVIGADTVVYSGNEIFGKPKDADEARKMILSLSDREHSVFTGIALIGWIDGKEKIISDAVETKVIFSHVSKSEAEYYAAHNEGADKAGAYAVQGVAGIYVKELHGDYFNVVGLPIARIRTILEEQFGLSSCDYIMKR